MSEPTPIDPYAVGLRTLCWRMRKRLRLARRELIGFELLPGEIAPISVGKRLTFYLGSKITSLIELKTRISDESVRVGYILLKQSPKRSVCSLRLGMRRARCVRSPERGVCGSWTQRWQAYLEGSLPEHTYRVTEDDGPQAFNVRTPPVPLEQCDGLVCERKTADEEFVFHVDKRMGWRRVIGRVFGKQEPRPASSTFFSHELQHAMVVDEAMLHRSLCVLMLAICSCSAPTPPSGD